MLPSQAGRRHATAPVPPLFPAPQEALAVAAELEFVHRFVFPVGQRRDVSGRARRTKPASVAGQPDISNSPPPLPRRR